MRLPVIVSVVIVMLTVMSSLVPNVVESIPMQAQPARGKDHLRRSKIVQMMQHSWQPHDERITFLIGSISTLYIMKLHKQYNEALALLAKNVNATGDYTAIDYCPYWVSEICGGMMSAHAITGNPMFREKLVHLTNRTIPLMPNIRVPQLLFSDPNATRSVVGGYLLEINHLAKIFEAPEASPLVRIADDLMRFLRRVPKSLHLAYDVFDTKALDVWSHHVFNSIVFKVPSFRIYDDLLALYLVTGNQTVGKLLDDFVSSALVSVLRSETGRTYMKLRDGRMTASCCSLGGFFALYSKVFDPASANDLMRIAEGLAATCHDANVLANNFDPQFFTVDPLSGAIDVGAKPMSNLGHASAYTYFVLWRLTHDERYRNWAWDTVIGLEAISRRPKGYASQLSYFSAGTLKYLYLLYSDDAEMSLDEWVFNRAGHAFPY